ncbi:hypothetical protein ACI8AC_02025 [Geodermatophilus sp. SYSU D00758]
MNPAGQLLAVRVPGADLHRLPDAVPPPEFLPRGDRPEPDARLAARTAALG